MKENNNERHRHQAGVMKQHQRWQCIENNENNGMVGEMAAGIMAAAAAISGASRQHQDNK
jgi:hypothetical protein